MVKFLIATHGFLADGFKSSIAVLMGQEIADKITTINAFVDGGDNNPKKTIENICDGLKENEELVVFTDLMYGSDNQAIMPYAQNKNIHVITGVNFPVICEILSKILFVDGETKVNLSELSQIIETAREQLLYVEKLEYEQTEGKEEENFFE